MTKTVVGLFGSYEEADEVVRDLRAGGFASGDISILANTAKAEQGSDGEETTNLSTGIGAGAAIGGIAGLILGIGALAIPGIGPIIAAGPIAAALTGAGIGAAAGGLLGTLSHMGVPEDEANFYAEGIRHGGALVAVHAAEGRVQAALDILNEHHAVDIDERDDDPAIETAAPVTPAGASPPVAAPRVYGKTDPYSKFEPAFRQHFQDTYPGNPDFRGFDPAYRLGHRLAADARYSASDFNTIGQSARAEYQQTSPARPWEEVESSVRYAFEKVSGRRA